MFRQSRYIEGITNFWLTKSQLFLTNSTKIIINDFMKDPVLFIPSVLTLSVLNNQCKKNNVKVHGYNLAVSISILHIVAIINCNRFFYETVYSSIDIDNMIMESVNFFYKCLSLTIDIIRVNKNGNLNSKLLQLCIEYSAKCITQITYKHNIVSTDKMKKTDLFCLESCEKKYDEYKKMYRVKNETILECIKSTYGNVCKLGMCLGWIIGNNNETLVMKLKELNDNKHILHIEKIGENFGKFIKLHDDFINIEKDISGLKHTLNYVVNNGIKESYTEMIETKTSLIEGSMKMGIDTKTNKEVIDSLMENIKNTVKDVSVDMNTSYDDVSVITNTN